MLVNNDRITLTGLEVYAHHGVFEHEREQGQLFIIDLTAWVDLSRAALSDELARTVNYADLANEVVAAVATDPVDLIETVAQRIADVALAHEAISRVEVTVHKPQAPLEITFADVAVTIERAR